MPQVLRRPLAEADLDDIWWYIAQDNTDAADMFLDKIEERSRLKPLLQGDGQMQRV